MLQCKGRVKSDVNKPFPNFVNYKGSLDSSLNCESFFSESVPALDIFVNMAQITR